MPPGQVEFGLRTNDAATLSAWVQKHTGPCGSPNSKEYYWDNVSNLTPVKVNGRDALLFDWQPCFTSLTLHVTAFATRQSYIFVLDWWSSDTTYVPTAQGAGEGMLRSFQG
jgi:hypothetical protein